MLGGREHDHAGLEQAPRSQPWGSARDYGRPRLMGTSSSPTAGWDGSGCCDLPAPVSSAASSSNTSRPTGSKVIRILFDAAGDPLPYYEDFMTGFVVANHDVWGRPVASRSGRTARCSSRRMRTRLSGACRILGRRRRRSFDGLGHGPTSGLPASSEAARETCAAVMCCTKIDVCLDGQDAGTTDARLISSWRRKACSFRQIPVQAESSAHFAGQCINPHTEISRRSHHSGPYWPRLGRCDCRLGGADYWLGRDRCGWPRQPVGAADLGPLALVVLTLQFGVGFATFAIVTALAFPLGTAKRGR